MVDLSLLFVMAAPPNESNGYLRVRCNGGLNQQRSAVGNFPPSHLSALDVFSASICLFIIG